MEPTLPDVPWPARRRLAADLISAAGGVLLALAVWHLLSTHVWTMLSETDPTRFALESVEAVFLVVPPVALLALGRWTAAQDLAPDRQWSILGWVLGGLAGVSAVVTAIAVHRILIGDDVSASLLVMELLTGAGAGALLGFAAGYSRVDSRRRAAELETQRDAFRFLNRLLRHHILNSVQVIDGYAARLEDREDPELREVHETIRAESRDITSLVQNVRGIIDTFTRRLSPRPVNLTAAVAAECETARRTYDGLVIETDLPEGVHAEATDLLTLAVRNLIDNAVRHNDRSPARLHVAIEERERTVAIRVRDNGPGISEQEIARALGPGETGDRGVGLYLVDRVVETQGGALSIEDASPRGMVVTVELPRATARDRRTDEGSRSTVTRLTRTR